jgi:hypothetical protein
MSFLPIRVVCVVALLAGCGSSSAGGAPSGGSDSGADGQVTTPGQDGGSDADASAGKDGATEAAPAGGDAGTSSDGSTGDGGTTVPIVPAFYVAKNGNDSNDGSLASPFATLGRAQTAMQGSTTLKTTYVRAGSYSLPTIASCGGSSCGLNLVAADDGETWSYYPPDGVDSADLGGGSTGNGTGLVVAVYVGASHVTINGLSIHDFQYAGINSQGGTDHLVVENCVIFNGYSQSNASNAGGISCYGCSNAVISHNVIHDIAQLGVSMSNVNGDISNLLVTGNVLYNTCNANADCGAIYVQDTKAVATNIQLTNNYVRDGNTFAGLGSNYGCALYADDCTSNVTMSGNVLTGRNGSNTTMVHGGSNVHQIGNLTDLASYQQHVAVFQTSSASGCASAVMSGNEYTNSVIIGQGGGGGYALLSGTPMNTPTIANNDYFNYGGASISPGTGAYGDTAPASADPLLSGWAYTMSPTSPVLAAPVSFPKLLGGWGPPGYVLPQTGSVPSCPH